MLPCERRQAGQQMIRDSLSCTAQGIDDAADIDCVPVNDGGDNQIGVRTRAARNRTLSLNGAGTLD